MGDITPSDGVPKVEKSRLEQAALNEMCNVLGGGMRGTFGNSYLNFIFILISSTIYLFLQITAEEIQELWREYEDNASLEANLVKDFDKVMFI